jgi:hypothetical protein
VNQSIEDGEEGAFVPRLVLNGLQQNAVHFPGDGDFFRGGFILIGDDGASTGF